MHALHSFLGHTLACGRKPRHPVRVMKRHSHFPAFSGVHAAMLHQGGPPFGLALKVGGHGGLHVRLDIWEHPKPVGVLAVLRSNEGDRSPPAAIGPNLFQKGHGRRVPHGHGHVVDALGKGDALLPVPFFSNPKPVDGEFLRVIVAPLEGQDAVGRQRSRAACAQRSHRTVEPSPQREALPVDRLVRSYASLDTIHFVPGTTKK